MYKLALRRLLVMLASASLMLAVTSGTSFAAQGHVGGPHATSAKKHKKKKHKKTAAPKNGKNGKNGANGAPGLQGLTGAAGPKGDTGAQGLAGPKGDPGAPGITNVTASDGCKFGGWDIFFPVAPFDVNVCNGAPGIQGDAGPQGPQGPKGDQGAPGQDGRPGANGAPGLSAYQVWLAGDDGILGTSDDNHGTVGDFMSTLKGPQGDTGGQGPKGDNGPQGPKGDQGPQGPAGIPNAVQTKICTVALGNGNGRKLGLGAICASEPDAVTVYIPQG